MIQRLMKEEVTRSERKSVDDIYCLLLILSGFVFSLFFSIVVGQEFSFRIRNRAAGEDAIERIKKIIIILIIIYK